MTHPESKLYYDHMLSIFNTLQPIYPLYDSLITDDEAKEVRNLTNAYIYPSWIRGKGTSFTVKEPIENSINEFVISSEELQEFTPGTENFNSHLLGVIEAKLDKAPIVIISF